MMKITKYPQSCIMVDIKGKRILVDPGILKFEESFLEEWKKADVILITHKHEDHCNVDAINKIVGEGVKVYTTKEVAEFHGLNSEIVEEGDNIKLDDINIRVVKAVHGFVPHLKGDKEINENVGYIIEGDKKVYHTGDSICFKNDYECDVLCVPVVNHGLVMGPYEAARFSKERNAELVVPIHYDNPSHPMDKEQVEKEFNKQELNYKFLEIGGLVEV